MNNRSQHAHDQTTVWTASTKTKEETAAPITWKIRVCSGMRRFQLRGDVMGLVGERASCTAFGGSCVPAEKTIKSLTLGRKERSAIHPIG